MNQTTRSSVFGALLAIACACGGDSAPASSSSVPSKSAGTPAASSGGAGASSAPPTSAAAVSGAAGGGANTGSAASAGPRPAAGAAGGGGGAGAIAGAAAGASAAAGSGVSLSGGAGAMAGAAAGASAAGGGGGAPAGAGASGGPASQGGASAFPKVSDFGADGPFKAMTMDGSGPNMGYTIYYPDALAPGGAKNPIVAWMSGGGTNPALYPLLPLLATHGFVVVASNTIPGIGAEVELGKEMIAGIDWAIAENGRAGSVFFGKLDTSKIAATGYSMGSLATFTIASDPRLTTTLHISGGNMAPERVNNLRAPAAFLCGTPGDASCNILSEQCDIAAVNCDMDFKGAQTPVFYGNFKGGHLGILTPPLQQQIQKEAVAWLRWQLMSDPELESRFVGAQCGLCKDSAWKVQQKNLQ